MAQLTFYPIGNADCTLIELNDKRIILKDFCNESMLDNGRESLSERLITFLRNNNRQSIDYVIFSHADKDHVQGAEDFFWFDHAQMYQSDDRVKIEELWVPSCFILEENLSGSARIIRQEARYRLKQGQNIRVFGDPEPLQQWLLDQGVVASRSHLIQKAGECIPLFDHLQGNVEIFVHSPFTFRIEEDHTERNGNSIVLHLTFFEGGHVQKCILGADAEHQAWSDIVKITLNKENSQYLEWDIFKISHHCSYTALAPEKGIDETIPVEDVDFLFDQGNRGCRIISSSLPIPNEDTVQPPHRQTANFYKRVGSEKGGEFLVTMEWPTIDNPQPLIIETTIYGFRVNQTGRIGIPAIIQRQSPRFGMDND